MSTANGFDPPSPTPDGALPSVVPAEPLLTVVPLEPPRPPHPGYWMALVWAIVFVLVVNLATIFALIPIMLVQALGARNAESFLNELIVQKEEGSPGLSPTGHRMMAPAVLIGQVVAILFAFLIVRLIVGRGWQRELAFRPPRLLHLGLLLLGLPGFLILPELLAGLARMVLPSFDYQKELNEMIRHWHWVYGVLGVGLGAGIGEELWCRGFLGRGLVARYGVGWGIVLTSFLFGLMHLDPPHVVATAVMGAALHFVYLMTRSLVASMLVHALNNSAGFLQLFVEEKYPDVGKYLSGIDAIPLLDKTPLFASCALLLAAVGWALYRSRVAIFSEAGNDLTPRQLLYPGVADPLPGSGLILARCPLPGMILGALLAAVLLFVGAYWWTGEQAKKRPPEPVPSAMFMKTPCLNWVEGSIV